MTHVLHVISFPWLLGPEFVAVPSDRSEFVRQQLALGSGVLVASLPAAPLLEIQAGDPCSANSAAPQGCTGQGYGAAGPMSTVVPLVPLDSVTVHRSTAKGIVTRMGQDPQGLGAEGIEPGAEGIRPAVSSACSRSCSGFFVDCADAPAACKRSVCAGAAACHAPPSNTGVNKMRSGHGV